MFQRTQNRSPRAAHRHISQLLGVGFIVALLGSLLTTQTASAQSPDCVVEYTITASWSTGFVGEVVITNYGPAINAWNLEWVFQDGQQLDVPWAANGLQPAGSDHVMIYAGASHWNGQIPSGGSVTMGFTAFSGTTNTIPTTFMLNGNWCGVRCS